MTRKLIATLLAAILALTSLAGCAALAEADEPVTVVLAQNTDPATLDPHKTGGDQAANVWRNIYETLLTYDAEDNLIPMLATSYEQVSDLEWVFLSQRRRSPSPTASPSTLRRLAGTWIAPILRNMRARVLNTAPTIPLANWEAIDEYTIKVTLDSVDLLFDHHVADVPMNRAWPRRGSRRGGPEHRSLRHGALRVRFLGTRSGDCPWRRIPNYHEGEPEV